LAFSLCPFALPYILSFALSSILPSILPSIHFPLLYLPLLLGRQEDRKVSRLYFFSSKTPYFTGFLRDSNEKDGWKIGRNLPSAAGAAGNKKESR
jgi:hypothetical protein